MECKIYPIENEIGDKKTSLRKNKSNKSSIKEQRQVTLVNDN